MKQKARGTLILAILLAAPALADWVSGVVPTGSEPRSVAVNPATNKIYVVNYTSSDVTVIDGATNATTTVVAGTNPCAVAVNPVTNKAYVANWGSNDVTIIDGDNNSTTTINVGTNPASLAVNPTTNRIYVANRNSNTVSVINGATETVDTTLASGTYPFRVAANPATNKIYVVGSYLMVIDGATNGTTLVNVGLGPRVVAVNPATNKIYVANDIDYQVNEVDGFSNSVIQVATANMPYAIAVNPGTNEIFVANNYGDNVLAIDGGDHGVDTVVVGSAPFDLAVNPASNKVYVANSNGASVTVIDGAAKTAASVAVGAGPCAIAVNPVTGKAYAASLGTDSISVINGDDFELRTITAGVKPLDVVVDPLTNTVYSADQYSMSVTKIDVETGGTTMIPLGGYPWVVKVNPLTNQAFALCRDNNRVYFIESQSGDTSSVPVGAQASDLAVDPATNIIYVANYLDHSVQAIDGFTKQSHHYNLPIMQSPRALAVNQTTNRIYVCAGSVFSIDAASDSVTAIGAGFYPWDIEVNRTTNRIYATNYQDSTVTVIDGNSHSTATIKVGANPTELAVNQVTNRVYVLNSGSQSVSIIDGQTDTVLKTVATGPNPDDIDIDPVTNTIIVANKGDSTATIIDGITGSSCIVKSGFGATAIAVNPVTHRAYTANYDQNFTVTEIDACREWNSGVAAAFDAEPGHVAYSARPTVSGHAANRWMPWKTGMMGVLGDWTTGQGAWAWSAGPFDSTSADSIGWTFNWAGDSLLMGENLVNIVPLEAQAASANNLGLGTPFAGNMLTYPIYRLEGTPPLIAWWDSLADDSDSLDGFGPYPVRAVITDFSGISRAMLRFRWSVARADTDSVAMARTAADTFSGVIPALPVASGELVNLHYSISACDRAFDRNLASTGERCAVLNYTGVSGQPPQIGIPRVFGLRNAYPNPARNSAAIRYQIPRACRVTLDIYSITGQLVKRFDEGTKAPDHHTIKWNTAKQPAGVYFYRLKAGEWQSTKKLVVIK